MASINYIIATHAQIYKRRQEYGDKYAKYALRYHLQILDSILKKGSPITQITIVCPDVEDDSGEYYTHNDMFINNLKNKNINVEKMIVENNGISYTQYIKCYMKYNNFDYYIIMEDDWTLNTYYTNFDTLLLSCYKKTFNNNIGFLNCWSPNKGKYVGSYGGFGHYTYSSAITLGILSNESLKCFLSHPDIHSIEQYSFSQFLLKNKIPIIDLPQIGLNTRIFFWETTLNVLKEYTDDTIPYIEPLFVPIQFYYKDVICLYNMTDKSCDQFIIHNPTNIFQQL